MESLQAVQQPWQIANGDYIDVPAFGAPDDGDSLVWDAGSGAFIKATLATSAALAAHIADTANPHGVTAAQVGSYTIANADAAIAEAVATHAAAADPHTGYLLATGTRAGASSQAQTFTNGVKTGKIVAIADSTNAGGWYKADGTTQYVIMDSINAQMNITGTLAISDTTADDAQKKASLTMRPFSSENKNVLLFHGFVASDSTTTVNFGGGTNAYDAATRVYFYTGATAQSGAGTPKMGINAQGQITLGHGVSGTAFADIAASTTTSASLRFRAGDVVSSPNSGDVWYPTSGRLNFRRSTTTEIFATGVQATGGAATATGSWTATEQGMLQKVYDAARAFGLLN